MYKTKSAKNLYFAHKNVTCHPKINKNMQTYSLLGHNPRSFDAKAVPLSSKTAIHD